MLSPVIVFGRRKDMLRLPSSDKSGDPGPLAGDGMTRERVASLAEAAASFARAEPWRHLEEEDLIHIEAPQAGPVRFASVLGSITRERGILFLSEPRQPGAVEIEELWMLQFRDAGTIPPSDLFLSDPRDESRRPSAGLLDLIETVLRALAVTTEDELDSGRWEKTVETSRGAVRIVLCLPGLLSPPEPEWDEQVDALAEEAEDAEKAEEEEWPEDFQLEDLETVPAAAGARFERTGEIEEGSAAPEFEARILASEAWEATGRRRVALARRALVLWPDCAEAWTLLADRERNPDRAVLLYSRALQTAGRGLDPFFLEIHAEELWDLPETRPFMRARLGLAEMLWEVDRREEAIAHFQELLRLDPMDVQGVHCRLVDDLLLLGRDNEAAHVLASHPDDTLVHSLYSRAVLAFRREGDSPGARHGLSLALARNRYVPDYLLTDDLVLDEDGPMLPRPGDRSEAVSYAVAAHEVWEATPGALDWLRERVAERRSLERGDRDGAGRHRRRKSRR
jgi:tetratricopeptide (TPR) repeat protein